MTKLFRRMMREAVSPLLYLLTGAAACALAFFIAVQFTAPALSQGAPPENSAAAPEKAGLMGFLKKAAREVKKQGEQFLSGQPSDQKGPLRPPQPGGGEGPLEIREQPASAAHDAAVVPLLPGETEAAPAAAAPSLEISPQGAFLKLLAGALQAEIPEDLVTAAQPRQHYDPPPNVEVESYVAPFIYDSANRRDPFEDPTQAPEEMDIDKEVVVIAPPRTPPEEYELGKIKIKGLMWNTEPPKVLVELPSPGGGFYTLRKGDKIGRNGVIYDIREDELVIVESFMRGAGSDAAKVTEMQIVKIDRLRAKKM